MDSTQVRVAVCRVSVLCLHMGSATVSATFFESSAAHPAAKKADLVIPISAPGTGGSGPDDNAPSVHPAVSVSSSVFYLSPTKFLMQLGSA